MHELPYVTLKLDEIADLREGFKFELKEISPGITRAFFHTVEDMHAAQLRVGQMRCQLLQAGPRAPRELAGLN